MEKQKKVRKDGLTWMGMIEDSEVTQISQLMLKISAKRLRNSSQKVLRIMSMSLATASSIKEGSRGLRIDLNRGEKK